MIGICWYVRPTTLDIFELYLKLKKGEIYIYIYEIIHVGD